MEYMYSKEGGNMENNLGLANDVSFYTTKKDFSTEIVFHSHNVAHIAKQITQEMGLSYQEQEEVVFLSQLHDIGKSNTPSEILYKPGKLTHQEWEIMKRHAEDSEKYLLESSGLYINTCKKEYYGKVLRSHHEKYAGGGYPDNLKGEEIPFMARIITIADVFEAITSPRIYRPNKIKNPLKVMDEEMGNSFDTYIYKNYARKVLTKYHKSSIKLL